MKAEEKINTFVIENKSSKYKLSLEGGEREIKFHLEELESLPKITFEENFTLESLKQKSKFFLMFETIEELMPDMLDFFKNKKYSLSFETNCAMISLFLPMRLVEEIILPIPQTESDPNSVIQELTISMNKLIKQIKSMKVEMNDMKELNKEINSMKLEMNEMKEFIDQLKEVDYIVGSINRNKALQSDKMIIDEKERKLIFDWISVDRKVKMELLYKATRDGDSSSAFHNKCDGKSPTLTLVKTSNGYRCGGFTSLPWDSFRDYKEDNNAFVFSMDTRSKYMSTNSNSIYCHSDYGPTFGDGYDLCLENGFLTAANSNRCNCPSTYKTVKQSELTGGEYNFTVKECEVYLIEYDN